MALTQAKVDRVTYEGANWTWIADDEGLSRRLPHPSGSMSSCLICALGVHSNRNRPLLRVNDYLPSSFSAVELQQ